MKKITAVWLALLLAASTFCAVPFTAAAQAPDLPSNGLPLVVIEVDESEAAIQAAAQSDQKHAYGTIEQMNTSPDHSVRCVGSFEISVPEGFEGEYGSTAVPAGSVPLKYIRGRGNSTWEMFAKKPYKIEFQEPVDFFGMGANTEWGLIANSMDDTLLKNRITYWLGEQLGMPYTPRLTPVDVVMKGSAFGEKYLGSYYLSELTAVGENRVEIQKLGKKVTEENPEADPNITGGYLFSMYSPGQNEDEPQSNRFTTPSGNTFIHHTPEFPSEDLTAGQQKQRTYLQNYVNALDDLIMNTAQTDAAWHEAIAEKMDMRSAADYWWVQEFSANTDAYVTDSTYLMKDRGGKLQWGPLWDFDAAWYVKENDGFPSKKGFYNTQMNWFDRLREQDPQFVALLKERWQDPVSGINATLAELTKSGGKLDQYKAQMRASWQDNRDNVIVPAGEEGAPVAFEECIEELRAWIEARRAWINAHLDEIDTVNATVTFEANGEVCATKRLRLGSTVSEVPQAPLLEHRYFNGWQEKTGGAPLEDYRIAGDTVFVAQYLDESEIVPATAVYFHHYEDWRALGDEIATNSYKIFPADAVPGNMEWSSSNEAVATVDADGVVIPKAVGDTTITLRLQNGVSNAYLLHVYDAAATPLQEISAVKITPETLRLKAGQSVQLQVSLQPEGTPLEAQYFFTSADEDVATVDEEVGVVSAVKCGKTTITVSTGEQWDDDAASRKTATCAVIVEHTLRHIASVEPTATTPGNQEYWVCTQCGAYFADAEGQQPIADKNSVILPPLGEQQPAAQAEQPAVLTPQTGETIAVFIGAGVMIAASVAAVASVRKRKKD